ncbi:MAG TPA: redoxin domain-containing protein, partial [Planctomycetota bacterium]|nr:redoxin domain-containing protein [Planctomycetota bacterium]
MMRLAILFGVLLAASDGDRAPDFALKDLHGREHRLSALAGRPAVVLVFTGIECPRGRAAEARLADLAARHPGVPFLAINPNRNESDERVAAHVRAGKWPLPVLRDVEGRVAAQYGVEVQPTAVVLDTDLR